MRAKLTQFCRFDTNRCGSMSFSVCLYCSFTSLKERTINVSGETTLWISKSDYSLRQIFDPVVITLTEARRMHEDLRADVQKLLGEPREHHYFRQYCYDECIFDEPIPSETFDGLEISRVLRNRRAISDARWK